MRVTLIAVGRLKAGAERELVTRYIDRAMVACRAIGLTGVDMREMDESRARRPDDRKAEESRAIAAQIPGGARLCVLDERGRAMTSPAFAHDISKARDNGIRKLASSSCQSLRTRTSSWPPAIRSGERSRAIAAAALVWS